MNIKQIRYFTAVFEHGSLSAAAQELCITVQAVSKAIADLESELGRDVFVRTSKGMSPTPFAFSFREKAIGALAAFEDLESFSKRYERRGGMLDRLRLVLNTPVFPGSETVCEKAAALIGGRLGIDVAMDVVTGEAGFDALRSKAYDVLVSVGTFSHPDVECRVVGTVPPAVIMAKEHPLAALDAVSLGDIAPYPIATSDWFVKANDTIVSGYCDRGAALHLVDLRLEDIGSHFKAGGLLFTTGISAMEKANPATAVRMIAFKDAVAVPICFVYLKNSSPVLLETIERVLADGLPYLGSARAAVN